MARRHPRGHALAHGNGASLWVSRPTRGTPYVPLMRVGDGKILVILDPFIRIGGHGLASAIEQSPA